MSRKYFLFMLLIASTLPALSQKSVEDEKVGEEIQQSERNVLREFNENKENLIHPNPTEGIFYVTSIDEGDDISIFDGTGRMVFNKLGEKSKTKIDVSHLEKGIYSVLVRDPDKKLKINQKVMLK